MGIGDELLDITLLGLTVAANWAGTARVMKKGTTEGVSLLSLIMTLLCVGTWLAYGAAAGNGAQMTTSAVALVATAAVLVVAKRNGDLRIRIAAAMAAAYVVIVLAGFAGFGLAAIGAVASLLSTVSKVPQITESWRNPGGIAVSISSFMMNGACSAGWVLYGVLHHDPFIIVTSAFAVAQAAFVVVRTVQGRADVRPPMWGMLRAA